jgi:hypothetical protein
MCYLCRKDIRQEKYKHFCQHFRAIPGPCTQCHKCDLYKNQEERQILLETAEKAKKEWKRWNPQARQIDFSLYSIGPANL